LTEPIKWQTKAKLSNDGISFLKQLLEHNPKKRLTAEEGLSHAWMKLTQSTEAGETISTETLRSAHKKVTATRKQVDEKVDKLRNQKLEKIAEDFGKGIRTGKRLGETPKEEFMHKPEFVRRDNKLTTAPSGQLNKRKASLVKLFKGADNATTPMISEDDDTDTLGALPQKPAAGGGGRQRAASMICAPKRLSYIGNISNQEEQNLANLYTEKSAKLDPILPGLPQFTKKADGSSGAATLD